MNIISIISDSVDDLNRRVVKFFSKGRSDVKTAYQITPCGVDSSPIEGMAAVYSKTSLGSTPVVVGYINKNQLAEPGEVRVFSIDSSGAMQTYIHLKADGTMEIGGSADFLARFNELKVGFDQLRADHNAFLTHVHGGVSTGGGTSGPPTPVATPSTASIDAAKIDSIKTP